MCQGVIFAKRDAQAEQQNKQLAEGDVVVAVSTVLGAKAHQRQCQDAAATQKRKDETNDANERADCFQDLAETAVAVMDCTLERSVRDSKYCQVLREDTSRHRWDAATTRKGRQEPSLT